MHPLAQKIVDRTKGIYSSLKMWQRIAIAGGLALVLALLIGLSVWMGRTEYKVLYTNLGPEDASRVVKALQGD